MFDDLLEQAVALKAKGEPFVLATVVACHPPTSAKPGAKAIVKADGTFIGWVGGSCSRPLVAQEALKALEDGQARLLILGPDSEGPQPSEGVLRLPMTCQSEGTLEVYMEPYLPKRELFVIGQSPVAQSLAALGKSMGFSVCACGPAPSQALFPDADLFVADLGDLGSRIGANSLVVVATMGHYDEEALAAVVQSQARYIALVTSPKRGKAVFQYLRDKGVSAQALEGVKFPAGLNIGAVTPEEIALSIMAEIVQVLRAEAPEAEPSAQAQVPQYPEAIDPVCGMAVDEADARYVSTYNGASFYFCCLRCKEAFDREPTPYLAQQHKG